MGEQEAVQLRMNRLFFWLFEHWCDGYDIDSGDLQEKMVELNLVRMEEYDPKKHLYADADEGDMLYVLLDEVKALAPKAGA